ncbi:hypothetical protein L6452_09348 [Arctium lappa]|uniref:Uncharacterized protein n=1 Tax=Arctium lappa TaxID=4217 RepID=A0ACB9DKY6_ARCLA|nr:hypothetical protein L6452_09348 [Arctium lappa]
MGATDNSKLAKKMDSEEAQNNGNKFQDGTLKFVVGADKKANSRKVSERGANKFGKLNGVDFVFSANMNNGVMNSNSSNVGHEYRPSEIVGGSGIDGFMKVNSNTTKVDSHLVNSMSGLNLGTRGPDFVTDLNFKKAESSFKGNRKINDEMDSLKSQSTGSCDYLKKLDNNEDFVPDSNIGFVFGSNLGNAFGDNPLSKVADEMKTSNIHDPSKVNVMDKINHSAANKIDEVNKAPAFEEKGKSDTVTKVYSFNKPEISIGSDGGVPNEPVNQKEKNSDGGHFYSYQLKTEAESIKDTFPSASSFSTTGLGFVLNAHSS